MHPIMWIAVQRVEHSRSRRLRRRDSSSLMPLHGEEENASNRDKVLQRRQNDDVHVCCTFIWVCFAAACLQPPLAAGVACSSPGDDFFLLAIFSRRLGLRVHCYRALHSALLYAVHVLKTAELYTKEGF